MDLSKLPRLSKTPPPPTDSAAPEAPASPATMESAPAPATAPCRFCNSPVRVGARFCDTCGAQLTGSDDQMAGGIAEAWISLAVAALLLILYPNFIKFLMRPSDTSAIDAFDTSTGVTIPYAHSAFIWNDLGVTLFCAVLVLDAAVMLFFRKRGLLLVALALSILTALFNVWAIIHTSSVAGFFPIQCAIAVAFAGYLAFVQLAMLRSTGR